MQTLILAQDRAAYSTRRLAEALLARGHAVQTANPLECAVRIAGPIAEVLWQDRPLTGIDLVLLRCTAFNPHGLAVVQPLEQAVARQWALAGARCVNDPAAKHLANDKFASLQVLAAAGLPVPETLLTWNPASLAQAIEERLGLPVILKTIQGTWGVGVMRADSLASAHSIFETMGGLERPLLAQRYIAEAAGRDIRAIVVGQEVISAFRRTAPAGEFRANIHRGAEPEMVELPADYTEAAIGAARALGLDLAGVDLLETAAGPLVLEVNPSPGWKQIERLTDIDVAGRIVEYVARLV